MEHVRCSITTLCFILAIEYSRLLSVVFEAGSRLESIIVLECNCGGDDWVLVTEEAYAHPNIWHSTDNRVASRQIYCSMLAVSAMQSLINSNRVSTAQIKSYGDCRQSRRVRDTVAVFYLFYYMNYVTSWHWRELGQQFPCKAILFTFGCVYCLLFTQPLRGLA